MRRLHFALLAAIVVAGPAFPQNRSVPRAIPLPDTMGANFSVGDTISATSGPADYDFLIGTWRFTFQARRSDGSFNPPFTGHWVFTSKQTDGQGVLIEDHWGADATFDRGKTWIRDYWTMEVHRISR